MSTIEKNIVREIYLRPGEFYFGEGNLRIKTLLGSCVSIVLWHPMRAHGGMCHYMLPSRHQARGNFPLDGRYADEAMELFMIELDKRHTLSTEYQVNVYGGGNMFKGQETKNVNIGLQNIEMAHHLLDQFGFNLAYDHLGNYGHRKIEFDVWDGKVRLIHADHRIMER